MKTKTYLFSFVLTLALTGLLGCQSASQSDTTRPASVQIQSHSESDIQEATTAVFREQGYTLTTPSPEKLVFKRPGSTQESLQWGDWTKQGVTIRVTVRLTDLPAGGHLLQAHAVAAQNSAFTEMSSRNVPLSSRPYQTLLDTVARRLPTIVAPGGGLAARRNGISWRDGSR